MTARQGEIVKDSLPKGWEFSPWPAERAPMSGYVVGRSMPRFDSEMVVRDGEASPFFDTVLDAFRTGRTLTVESNGTMFTGGSVVLLRMRRVGDEIRARVRIEFPVQIR